MRKTIHWAWVMPVLLTLGLYSCDEHMSVPSYLRIDSTTLHTNYYLQGTSSANISDVWVTVNGKSMGGYELPATVPIFASGTSNIKIEAGIKMNGQVISRPTYPFFTIDEYTMDLQPTQVYTLAPSFSYLSSTVFEFKEDFEDAGIKFEPVENSVSLSKTSDPALIFKHLNEHSRYSGMIELLPEDSTYFEVQTSVSFPRKMTYCFLEMNYRFTHNVEVGIYYHYNGRNYQYPVCGIYGSTERGGDFSWKKIYVNLTDVMNANSLMITDFEIYFKGIKNRQDTALYLFDNIKVLYL